MRSKAAGAARIRFQSALQKGAAVIAHDGKRHKPSHPLPFAAQPR
jgi:hypothetical protein